MTTGPAAAPIAATRPAALGVGAGWPTLLVAALIAWLPLQTPIAVLLYQYGGISVDAARVLLLLKDVAVAAGILALLPAARGRLRLGLADGLAAGYGLVVVAYAVIPRLAGDQLPAAAVIASLRELLVPLELYALGRLAIAAGADATRLAWTAFWAGLLSAVAALGVLVLAPQAFLASTVDLVRFVREVQGVASAVDLHKISILAHYGGDTLYERAVVPFTHPVGTGHYLVLPLALATARLALGGDGRRLRWIAAIAAVVLAAAIVGTISRGAWAAAAVAVAVVGWRTRRLAASLVALGAVAAFVLLVPPFSHSIASFVSGEDPSTQGHGEAIVGGLELLRRNPLGLGVGWSDFFGQVYGGGEVAGGETLYLNLAIAAGPLALVLFVAWLATIVLRAGSVRDWLRRRRLDDWITLGVVAATVGFAVSAITSSPLLRFSTAATYWLLVGVVATRAPRPGETG